MWVTRSALIQLMTPVSTSGGDFVWTPNRLVHRHLRVPCLSKLSAPLLLWRGCWIELDRCSRLPAIWCGHERTPWIQFESKFLWPTDRTHSPVQRSTSLMYIGPAAWWRCEKTLSNYKPASGSCLQSAIRRPDR